MIYLLFACVALFEFYLFLLLFCINSCRLGCLLYALAGLLFSLHFYTFLYLLAFSAFTLFCFFVLIAGSGVLLYLTPNGPHRCRHYGTGANVVAPVPS